MPNDTDNVTTTISIPRALRVRLDEVRLDRARRNRTLTPPFTAVVIEALEELVAREDRR